MSEPEIQKQIFESINRATRVLIPLGKAPSGDSLSAALALRRFLQKLDKEVVIVGGGKVAEKYLFLPESDLITEKLEESRSFVISVKTDQAPLDELSYHHDEQEGVVNIYLRPKEGIYNPEDVTFRSDKFPYDLIIALGIPTLDVLGELYDKNTDLFFETPIVNIDHHTTNEHFGEINLIDITATSTAEILVELLEKFETGLIDKEISTNLLAGIMIETNSFQHIKTTPKAFLKASSLISMGADQQGIIKHLYKTKTISLLKLWGRALARIKERPDLSLSYSLLKKEDMEKSGTGDILPVMEELSNSLPEPRLLFLLAESDSGRVEGYYRLHPSLAATDFALQFDSVPVNSRYHYFKIENKSLHDAESETLNRLERLKSRIGG